VSCGRQTSRHDDSFKKDRDPSPLVPEVVGGTKVALYAVVRPTRPRQEAIPVGTVIPTSTAIAATTQKAAERRIAAVTAAYTFWLRALESSADYG
jgi:hypothetical protein